MDRKTTGIIAYLTLVGWLIAFCAGDREGAKFHLNQALVILIAGKIRKLNNVMECYKKSILKISQNNHFSHSTLSLHASNIFCFFQN